MNANKVISRTTAALVVFLAIAAAVLSYDALRGLAADNGVTKSLDWLWPLTLDGFIIVASLSVLRNSLLGERTAYAWSLVIGFSLASIGFNIVHAPPTLTGRAIAAVPPLALLLSFELLMSQLKSEVKRAAILSSLAELATQADDLGATIEKMTAEADKKAEQVDQLKAEITTLRSEKRAAKPGKLTGQNEFIPGDLDALDQANETRVETMNRRREQLADILADNPDLTNGQLADILDVSVSTVKADKKALGDRLIDAANEDGRPDLADIITNVRDGLSRSSNGNS